MVVKVFMVCRYDVSEQEILQVLVEMEDTILFQLFAIVCSTLARRDPARY